MVGLDIFHIIDMLVRKKRTKREKQYKQQGNKKAAIDTKPYKLVSKF